MSIFHWVIVLLPVCVLLAGLFFAWRYIRRGTTPIHRAAATGNRERLEQLLLANPESVGKVDLIGFTPLHHAAHWGQVEAAQVLLTHRADLANDQGLTPLHHAAAGGHEAVVRLFLEHGADVNARAPSDDSTPLISAVISRHADVARILIAGGADVDAKTKSGWTACHFAAGNGDEATMNVLLENKADWQSMNANNDSPLQVALANGHSEIVKLVQQHQNESSAVAD